MLVFALDEEQLVKLNKWQGSLPKEPRTAIGGRFVYSFCQTSLGIVAKVTDDVSGQTIDLTDYDSW